MKTQNLTIDLTSPELTTGLLEFEQENKKELSAMATEDNNTDDDTNDDDIVTEHHNLTVAKTWNGSVTALRKEKQRYRRDIKLLSTISGVHIPPDEALKKASYERLKMALFEMIRLWLKKKAEEREAMLNEIEDDWDLDR